MSPRSAAVMKETNLGCLDPEEETSMVAQAVALRKLVRVKLADDADVQQAQVINRKSL